MSTQWIGVFSLLVFVATASGARAIDLPVAHNSDTDSPAAITYESPAYFSSICRRMDLEGAVRVAVEIKADGSVGKVDVIMLPTTAGPVHVLEHAAQSVARRNKYRPATSHGQAVPSVLEFDIDFVIPRNSDGSPDLASPISYEPRSESKSVPERRICLYGHWVSGEVEIRLDQTRCYVDGIRLWPAVYDLFPIEAVQLNRVRSHHKSVLRIECELLWRDLIRQGLGIESVVESMRGLVRSFPGVCRLEVDPSSAVEVEFCDGELLRLSADVQYPGQWSDGPPRPDAAMFAESYYYEILSHIDRGCRLIAGNGKYMNCGADSLLNVMEWDHDVENALAAQDSITIESWAGRSLPASFAEIIRNPWWIYKQ